MSKLQSLNNEQTKLMKIVRDEYINLLNNELNKNDAIEGVKWLYKISGLTEPEITIVDSPLAIRGVCNGIKENKIENQLWNQIENQLWNEIEGQVRYQVDDQVRYTVWSQIEDKVWYHIEDQVRYQVWNQLKDQTENQHLKHYTFSHDIMRPSYHVSFYEYFKRIGIVKNNNFDKYVKYIKSGVFMCVYLDKLAVLCRNPEYIKRDSLEKMHSYENYAIRWRDGYQLHYVHGVFFDDALFEKIFIKKDMPTKDIMNLRNAEQKACAIEFVKV